MLEVNHIRFSFKTVPDSVFFFCFNLCDVTKTVKCAENFASFPQSNAKTYTLIAGQFTVLTAASQHTARRCY